MSPHKPEDWPRQFEQQLNAGHLEAVVALYEPNASFVSKSGELVVGRDGIRLMLAGLIGMKAQLQGTGQPDGTWKLIVGDPNGRG